MCKNWQIITIQATMKPHQQGRKIKTRCRSETCPRLILLYFSLRGERKKKKKKVGFLQCSTKMGYDLLFKAKLILVNSET